MFIVSDVHLGKQLREVPYAFRFLLFNNSSPGVRTYCRNNGRRLEKRILDARSICHITTSFPEGHKLVVDQ